MEVQSRLLAVEIRSRLLAVEIRLGSGSYRSSGKISSDEIRKVVDHRRNLNGVWLLQKSCCWGSSYVDEAQKEFGVKSIVAGRSLEEIRRVVNHCRESTESEA